MVNRRIGAESSATRILFMDAVETVMRTDGYGALTGRSVAQAAGLKHQLVYYYFQTLEDLLIATYERHIARYQQRIETALAEDRPLHAFWQAHANPVDSVLNMEFLSLANHNGAIRERTIAFGEDVRRLGLERLNGLKELSVGPVRPLAATMALSAIGSVLGLEAAIGIGGGHADVRALVEWCIDHLEP